MTEFQLDARVRLSIELALTAGSDDPLRFSRQDVEAERLGMSGAEVDLARRGASFQFQTSKAIALALAIGQESRALLRERAVRAGIDARTCADIERFAADIVVPASSDIEDEGP